MLVATYEQRKDGCLESAKSSKSGKDRLVDCHECKGHGESECDCCGREATCQSCDGEGQVDIKDIPNTYHLFPAKDYYTAVIRDLKSVCGFTNKSFFREALPFIRSYKKQFGYFPRRYRRRAIKAAA